MKSSDARCGVRLSLVLDIPSGHESNHIRNAPDYLKDLFLVVSLRLLHPTILQCIFMSMPIPNTITNGSVGEKILASP
jgi:hypothetical protein